MKLSEKNDLISKALVQALSEITNTKNTASNPFFKNKYTPLHEIISVSRGVLNKYGIIAIQDVSNCENGVRIKTLLLHNSGQWIEQEGLDIPADKQTPQSFGSAITYGRRYTLSAMLGISSEDDDDGNAGSKKTLPKTPPKKEHNIEPLVNAIKDADAVKKLEAVQHKLSEQKQYMTPAQIKTLAHLYTEKMSTLIEDNFKGEEVAS